MWDKKIYCTVVLTFVFINKILLFTFHVSLYYALLSVPCSFVKTCWERSLVYGVFLCFCHFPIGCRWTGVALDCIHSRYNAFFSIFGWILISNFGNDMVGRFGTNCKIYALTVIKFLFCVSKIKKK